MAHLPLLLPLLALAACGGDSVEGQGQGQAPATEGTEVAQPTGPQAHPDDPAGWVPFDQFEGKPVELTRTMHPGGGLRRIVSYHADRVGDPDGRHGPEWSFFKDGFKKEELIFRDGVAQGPFMAAWKNGQPRHRGTYVDGKRHGLYEQWLPNGDQQLRFSYHEGTPVGTWTEWYVGMARKLEENYEGGLKSGERRLWDKPAADENGDVPDEGHLTRIEHYQAGALHGPWQDYDPFSGTPRTGGQFEHGKAVGTWRMLYRDGTVLDEYAYVDGLKHGLQRKFTPEGTPLEELTWDAGVQTGPARTFHADGQVQAEGNYVDGLRQGRWTYYTPTGDISPAWSGLYENDEKVGDLPGGP